MVDVAPAFVLLIIMTHFYNQGNTNTETVW